MTLFSGKLSRVELLLYGDDLPKSESALVICNHLGFDFLQLHQLAIRCGMGSHIRFVQKGVLKWIPINWTCYLNEHIFIEKGGGQAVATQVYEALRTFGIDRVPTWVVLFPEGTWVAGPRERWIVERSHAYARKMGLPVLKNVVTPRTMGFEAAVRGLIAGAKASGEDVALYDLTMALSDPAPSVVLGEEMPFSAMDFINGGRKKNCPQKVHLHIQRVPMGKNASELGRRVVEDPDGYLQDAFVKKNDLLDHFSEEHCFPGPCIRDSPGWQLPVILATVFVILASWCCLWLISPKALEIYLLILSGLLIVVSANVSWDESSELPASLRTGSPDVKACAGASDAGIAKPLLEETHS